MAEKKPVVKHAILTLAASYILDFNPSEGVRQRANYHYGKAVLLLGEELKDIENRVPGKGEALIASLIVLGHNEVCSRLHSTLCRSRHFVSFLSADNS